MSGSEIRGQPSGYCGIFRTDYPAYLVNVDKSEALGRMRFDLIGLNELSLVDGVV